MSSATLHRQTFQTSRLMEYFSEKELTLQTGHAPDRWLDVLLKELTDNPLDACEGANTPPEIAITVTADTLIIEDNGPGIPLAVMESILDFSVRVSSKDAYISPTRGAQGNALKTVLAIPFVLAKRQPRTIAIETQGRLHAITITVDQIAQAPEVRHAIGVSSVKTGTRITIPVGCSEDDLHARVLPLIEGYSLFNPHATFTCQGQRFERTVATCQKWKPSDPTSAYWYTPAQLSALMAAYVSAERRGGPAITVRDFIGQFKGLSSTVKRKVILSQLPALAACGLNACVANGTIDPAVVTALLAAMQQESKPVKPLDLGVLGQRHLQTWLTAHGGVDATIEYRRVAEIDAESGLPFVFEFAFGARHDAGPRRLLIGINAAPTLVDPFRSLKDGRIGLDGLLSQQYVSAFASVTCVAHLTCPHLHYTDRGKSSLDALASMGEAIHRTVTAATKRWADMEKKRIRDDRRGSAARDRWFRGLIREPSIKEAAFAVMRDAYAKASGGGRYPATARQVMYAARPLILAYTDKPLSADFDSYFTQSLLPEFQRDHPDATASWDVVYDARGHLAEPHTNTVISLGTLSVRGYLRGHHDGVQGMDHVLAALPIEYPTTGPAARYRDVLFLEKEGFNDLLAAARIAQRFDLAIMSTKGYSSTAARTLIERLSGVRILVLHDFDKDGLGILHTLQHDTVRYQFAQPPEIIDLGIRFTDVEAERLQSEPVTYSKSPLDALLRYGATAAEIEFLFKQRRRVELNAFPSDQFIVWLERKLKQHNVTKMIPPATTLAAAYRRATMLHRINQGLGALRADARAAAERQPIPRSLRKRIADRLKQDPAEPWDAAVAAIAAEAADE